MASVASQLMEEVTAHAQSYSLEDAREICAYGTYFPNNVRMLVERFQVSCNKLLRGDVKGTTPATAERSAAVSLTTPASHYKMITSMGFLPL